MLLPTTLYLYEVVMVSKESCFSTFYLLFLFYISFQYYLFPLPNFILMKGQHKDQTSSLLISVNRRDAVLKYQTENLQMSENFSNSLG